MGLRQVWLNPIPHWLPHLVRVEDRDHDRLVARLPDQRVVLNLVEIPSAEPAAGTRRPDRRHGAGLVRRAFVAPIRDGDLQVPRHLLQALDQLSYRHCAHPSLSPTIGRAKGDGKLPAMLENMWAQWLTVAYMVLGTMAAVVVLLPMVIRVSEALRNHLGHTAWNYLVIFVGVLFMAWTVFAAWMLLEEQRQGQEILDRLLPLFEQLTPEEPTEQADPSA